MRWIIILTIGVLGFSGCKKDGSSNTSPLEVSVEVSPENPTEGETVVIAVSATGADETVDARYTLSHDSMSDSVIERTLSPENGTIEDELEIQRVKAGDYTLLYRLSDQQATEDIKEGALTITVRESPDAPAQLSVQPEQDNLYTFTTLTFDISVEDADGVERVVVVESEADSLIFEDISGTRFSEQLVRTFESPRTYELTIRLTDGEGNQYSQSFAFEILRPGDEPTQFALDIPGGRVGDELSWSFSATDSQGIEKAVAKYVRTGQTDSTEVPLTVSGETVEGSAQVTPSETGTYVAVMRVTDGQQNTREESKEAQIYAPLTQRTLIVDAGFEGIDVSLTLGVETQSGSTNSGGTYSATFTAPEDSVIDYALEADALGLLKLSEQGQNSGDQNIAITPEKVPITISSSLPGQYPGETKTHDISDLVTADDPEQGPVPVELTFSYSGANFDLSSDGTHYTFTPTKNETGIVEDFNLSVTAPFDNSAQRIVTKEIFAPRAITINDALPDGKENTDLVLEAFSTNYVQSEATIDSVNVTTSDANISVTRDGETFTIAPDEGFFGNATITVYARNIDGAEKNEQRSVYFEALPRANITAINSVTNQAIESYLLFRDETEAVIDSVVSSTGQFEVGIPENAVGLSVAEQVNGEVKSFEHYVPIDPTQPITRTVPVEDFRDYDLDKNFQAEMSLFDMKRFKWLMEIVHGQAPVINLDGTREGSGFNGVLHRAVESDNGVGYNALIIPDTTDWVLFDETGIMEPGTPDLIENEYLTKIAPVMESFAIPVQRKERIVYDHNNKQPDVAYINPRLLRDAFGTIAVLGKLPYTNKQSIAQLLQDGERKVLSDEAKKRATLQELTNGMIYFSQKQADWGGSKGIPSEYQLGPEESIIHDSTTRLDLSVFDRKAGWMIYEPYNLPGEKIDHILSIPNQIKAEYDAL